jgi:hypothetical protein
LVSSATLCFVQGLVCGGIPFWVLFRCMMHKVLRRSSPQGVMTEVVVVRVHGLYFVRVVVLVA